MGDACDQHLVDCLGGLSGTDLAHVGDAQAVSLQGRVSLGEIGRTAADHDRELAVDSAFDAAGNWRIQKADAVGGQERRRGLCGRAGDGAVVDDDAAGLHDGGQGIDIGEHVFIGRHAQGHDIAVGEVAGVVGGTNLEFCGQGICLFDTAIAHHGEQVARGQMSGHRASHGTESDESAAGL